MNKLKLWEYLIISSLLLNVFGISAIVYLFNKPMIFHKHRVESHSHSASDVTYNSFEVGGFGTLQREIKEIDDKADERHSHSAKDITYQSFEWGGVGTLQNKIKEIDDKTKKRHTHDSFDIIGTNSHMHDSFDIIGIDNHTHYEYAPSFHIH